MILTANIFRQTVNRAHRRRGERSRNGEAEEEHLLPACIRANSICSMSKQEISIILKRHLEAMQVRQQTVFRFRLPCCKAGIYFHCRSELLIVKNHQCFLQAHRVLLPIKAPMLLAIYYRTAPDTGLNLAVVSQLIYRGMFAPLIL